MLKFSTQQSPGLTLSLTVVKTGDGQVFSPSAKAFEAKPADYGVPMVESGAPGIYVAEEADVPTGEYLVLVWNSGKLLDRVFVGPDPDPNPSAGASFGVVR